MNIFKIKDLLILQSLIILLIFMGCNSKPTIDEKEIVSNLGNTPIFHVLQQSKNVHFSQPQFGVDVTYPAYGKSEPKGKISEIAKISKFKKTDGKKDEQKGTYQMFGTVKIVLNGGPFYYYGSFMFYDNTLWENEKTDRYTIVNSGEEHEYKCTVSYGKTENGWSIQETTLGSIVH